MSPQSTFVGIDG